MREIGVRQLKASLSETLKAVGNGEQIRVTVRGRPVADIVPAGEVSGDRELRELVAAGRVVLPSRSRPERAPRLAATKTSATDLILAERDAAR
jgi:prevent-host-death family protein